MTKISGWPGTVRSGPTMTRPARSVGVPVASATVRANDEARTPAPHRTVRVGISSSVGARRAVGTTRTDRSSIAVTRVSVRTVTPSRSSWRRAERERSGGYGGRTRSSASMRMIRASAGIDRAEVAPQRVAGDLAERPGQLDAGRSATDQHEGHPLASPLRVGFPFRGLERDEDASPDLGRVLEGLEAGGDRGPLVVPEVRVVGAGRDDERVVGERAAVGDEDLAPDSDRCPTASPRSTVVLRWRAQDGAQRLRDVARRQGARRDLVEHRLEQVEVAPIDQRQRDLGVAAQAAGGIQATEPAADDDDAMARVGRAVHGCGSSLRRPYRRRALVDRCSREARLGCGSRPAAPDPPGPRAATR